jgi:hypothetical protein
LIDADSTQKYDRTVFYVSDGTGITAETFGHSLLTQFGSARLREQRLPFIDSTEKAEEAVRRINRQAQLDRQRPIVFSTLVDAPINEVVRQATCRFFDLFASFVEPLEQELGVKSSHTIGQSHTASNIEAYGRRIAAINYALSHDDGQTDRAAHRQRRVHRASVDRRMFAVEADPIEPGHGQQLDHLDRRRFHEGAQQKLSRHHAAAKPGDRGWGGHGASPSCRLFGLL